MFIRDIDIWHIHGDKKENSTRYLLRIRAAFFGDFKSSLEVLNDELLFLNLQ